MSDRSIRLFIDQPFNAGSPIVLSEGQAHYILNVMRLKPGDAVHAFNGRDGEWSATVVSARKKQCLLDIGARLRPQTPEPDVWLAFAPLKKARTDLVVEKATELGASALWPVFTKNTNAERINLERLRTTAIEAAEQCERLSVPAIHKPSALEELMLIWPSERQLFVLDETGAGQSLAHAVPPFASRPCGFLIGPEGGFTHSELDGLGQLPFVSRVGLGPRILRAETAAIAALVGWQSLAGDWR